MALPGPDEDPLRRLVHDLRAPLTIASGFADLLARRGATLSDAERTEHLQRIDAALAELRALVDQAAARSASGTSAGPK